MADARRIPKSVMLIKQICVHVQSCMKCHLKIKEASQQINFVMTIFFLIRNRSFTIFRGFAVYHTLCSL